MRDWPIGRAGAGPGLVLLDAAMGTRLIARGLDLAADDPCLWAVDRPEVVEAIHRADAAAGSEAIVTNTFGANRSWLRRFGREREVERINRSAVELARSASTPDGLVLGCVGPTASSDRSDFDEQVDALAGAGVDAVLVETLNPGQAASVARWLAKVDHPSIISLFDWGDRPEDLAGRLIGSGADFVGINCVDPGPASVGLARRLAARHPGRLAFRPSKGGASADDFAAAVRSAGATLVGGCCGTTEADVAAIRRRLPVGGALL